MNKYTSAFIYWHEGSGYSHSETFDSFEMADGNESTVADYIDNSDLEWKQFSDYCDVVAIELRRNGKLIERAFWDETGLDYDDLEGYEE